MSSNKEKIFYCVANALDGLRYTPKALEKDIQYLSYGDGIKHFFPILKTLLQKKTILLNSYRLIDRSIARAGIILGCKVIILQHGRNEYFESRGPLLLIKKFLTVPRYRYELFFLLIINLWFGFMKLKRQELKGAPYCKLFYFTQNYKNLWVGSLRNLDTKIIDVKVSTPNPITWGTEIPIARIQDLPVFLVDEPLDTTIGMSDEMYLKLIYELSIELDLDKIYTRRHPRSDIDKFKKTSFIYEIEEVPNNVKVLIGYKSNLLFSGINAEKFYQFDAVSLKAVNPSILKNTSSQESGDYSSLTKEFFLCD